MRNNIFLPVMLLFIFCVTSSAQRFEKAPAPKVKQIIEWAYYTQLDNQDVQKWSEYEFREDGKLTHWIKIPEDIEENYQYTKFGQVAKLNWRQYEDENEINYGYKKNYYVEEFKTPMGKVKTFYYVNKKRQIIEVKEFYKMDGNKTYALNHRSIYNYDDRDSLKGVMDYNYIEEKNKTVINKSKTLYFYFPENGKLKEIMEYDHYGNLFEITEYHYDEANRLELIDKWRKQDVAISTLTKIEYLKGQLWQKTHVNEHGDIMNYIYKDGLLIREKEFADDELIRVSDFQYVYYD